MPAAAEPCRLLRAFSAIGPDGVTEYWIFDPVNQTADFFVLENGRYERRHADAEGVYRSAALSAFWLKTSWLWERPPVRQLLAQLLPPA